MRLIFREIRHHVYDHAITNFGYEANLPHTTIHESPAFATHSLTWYTNPSTYKELVKVLHVLRFHERHVASGLLVQQLDTAVFHLNAEATHSHWSRRGGQLTCRRSDGLVVRWRVEHLSSKREKERKTGVNSECTKPVTVHMTVLLQCDAIMESCNRI